MSSQFLIHIIFFFIYYDCVVPAPISVIPSSKQKEEHNTLSIISVKNVTVYDDNNMLRINIQANNPRSRVKRQNSGAGKFAEASKMPQLKLLRLFLQMFKNFWDRAYVGGSHPLHPNVPKAIIALYKEKVVEFFIPDVGQEKAMQ